MVCAMGITEMTTGHGALQKEQITRNVKSKFKSNEDLNVPICEVGSFKVSAFSELSVCPKEELILEVEEVGFFFFLINSKVVEPI